MTSSKTTKRALVASAFAMLMCITMLIGTTFAWFTDTASTSVNKIQSGTLDVELWQATTDAKLDSSALKWVKATDGAEEEVLWEPGATYNLESFRIKNNGSLALKYQVQISDIVGDAELLDVIDFTVKVGDGTATPLANWNGTLAAEKVTDAITITGTMKTTAGNDYQGKTINGLSITVVATQDTVEYDSKDNTYDESAEYPVVDAAAMKEAMARGGIISINRDIKTDSTDNEASRVVISNSTTLNLDAKIISPDNMGDNNTNFCALIVDANTTINASQNGGINTGTNGGYAIDVRNGANLTITGGSYYGGGTAVQVEKGTVTITGGHFAVEKYGDPYGYNFLLNCVDDARKSGNANIIVKGGTFVNFDPSNNTAEGTNTNFVATGYKVVSETQTSGDIWYTVVKDVTE